MFSNNEKEQMLKNFEEIISKTYKKKIGVSAIDNQYVKTDELLRYYKKSYGVDFQKSVLSGLKDLAYEKLFKNLEHDKDEDKQKDEGKDIQNEDIEKDIQEQIDKSKMPSDTIDKEQILKELGELAEDEKEITKSDIKSFVKAATIKAIYEATLEKYEINREEIKKHSDIVLRRDGEFALEDRLALENRQYEVYLQKLSKEYKNIVPNHKELQLDKKIAKEEEQIRNEHNKNEKIKEKRRQDEIDRIIDLYDEKAQIEEEMAQMSANPVTFNKNRFEELQDRLYSIDRELCQRPGPAVLIENIERDERQERLDKEALGVERGVAKASIATTSRENEAKEQLNNEKLKEETYEAVKQSTDTIEDVIEEYRKCSNARDYEGAKRQYQILKSISGSKDNLQSNIKDVTDDGKEDYKTENEKDSEIRENLNLNAVNDEDRTAEFDLMDAEVDEIARKNNVQEKSHYQSKEANINEPKQHTLYGNKRPY